MTESGRWLWIAVLGFGFFACTPGSGDAPPPAGGPQAAGDHPHVALLQEYVDAFNAEDLDGMLALAHEEIEWMTVTGATVSVETSGAQALREAMGSYFQSVDTRSSLEGAVVNGDFVSFVERATWVDASGTERSQTSSAIGEIANGKLRRVWYFSPAS